MKNVEILLMKKVEFGRNKIRDWLKDKNQLESFPDFAKCPNTMPLWM